MAKEKILNLKIPASCDEDWDAMRPSGCGRFCDQCNKTVIDFTEASDRELVLFFAEKKKHICGRFREDQLNRPIPFSEPREYSSFRRRLTRLAASILLAQVTTSTMQAQDKASGQQIVLKGSISDYLSQKPLIGMTITIDGLSYQKYSDKNGAFAFVLPADYAGKNIVITATYQPGSSPELAGFAIRSEQVQLPADSGQARVQLQRYPFQQLETVAVETHGTTITRHFYSGALVADVQPVLIKISFWNRVKGVFKKKKQ